LAAALALLVVFALAEWGAGVWANSLALISDAGHMVTDAAALALALFAMRVARRPPSARLSFGYARAEVLGALINGLAMLVLVVWIVIEALQRLRDPAPVIGSMVMLIGGGGLIVNLIAAWLLSGDGHNLNTRAALLHVMGDLLASVAAVAAGLVIWLTGWTAIDPILSVLVSLLILRSTWKLLMESTHVLMQGVPLHLDLETVGRTLAAQPGVRSVHDLHIWHMGQTQIALSAHLVIDDPAGWPRQLAALQAMLAREFEIDHVTLQPSWASPLPTDKVIPVMAVDPVARGAGHDHPPHRHGGGGQHGHEQGHGAHRH
jgi:cobalt-zinc-cadmium efflux system protein